VSVRIPVLLIAVLITLVSVAVPVVLAVPTTPVLLLVLVAPLLRGPRGGEEVTIRLAGGRGPGVTVAPCAVVRIPHPSSGLIQDRADWGGALRIESLTVARAGALAAVGVGPLVLDLSVGIHILHLHHAPAGKSSSSHGAVDRARGPSQLQHADGVIVLRMAMG